MDSQKVGYNWATNTAPWKESYDRLRQYIKKQRYHSANKDSCSQSCGFFPVVTCGCESWTIKKAEHWRTDSVKLWCWRRLLRVPWTARRSNQSILKEINHKYSLEGLMLKLYTLATWCEEPTHWKRPWCWQGLRAGEGGDRGWDGWMASSAQWEWVWANSRRWWRTGSLVCCSAWGRKGLDTT